MRVRDATPVVLNKQSIVHSDEIRHDVRSKEVGLVEPPQYTSAVDGSLLLQPLVVTNSRLITWFDYST